MKKQTILIVHNRYRIPGGEDIVAKKEASLLKEHGHKVVLYTRDNSEIDRYGKGKKILLPFETIFSLKTYHEIRRIIRKEQVDIVHVHNTLLLISMSVYYAAVAEKVPVVQTMHNFRLLCPAGTFFHDGHVCEKCVYGGMGCAIRHKCYRKSRLQTILVAAMLSFHRRTGILGKVYFICLTEFNRGKLLLLNKKRQIIDPEKVYIKPNFTTIEAKRRPPEGYYIAIGRIEALKGSALIAKAFARNGKRLLFVGEGEQSESLNKFIKKAHAENIECVGKLPHEKTMELLAGAEALITASAWYETFGMTVIEAYACGVPVIARDFGNIANLIRDGVTGIRYSGSVESLMEAVDTLEDSDREKMRDGAFKEYLDKYADDGNYERLKAIYDRLPVPVRHSSD